MNDIETVKDESGSVSVAMIWAMSRNRVIGRDNKLPWHLPDDLRHFKRTTLGMPIIMGRRTYESTGGALPGRLNIIVTSGDLNGDSERLNNVVLARSVEEALALGKAQATKDDRDRCFVCGGSALYAAALPLADELFVTQVDVEVEGDVFFPEFDLAPWECVSDEAFQPDERHALGFSFLHYQRKLAV